MFIILLPLIVSITVNIVLLSLSRIYSDKFLDIDHKPHAVHKNPVPRVGGLSIFSSYLLTSFFLENQLFDLRVLLPATLVFGLGFLEDLRKDLSPKLRLEGLILFSALATLLVDLKINTIGFLQLPSIIAFPLTIIAIAGFTNAINIIDGLNGLASGISAIFLFFLGITFYEYGYSNLALLCFIILAGILGFMFFNFPYGKIFLGDGGAYFLGFMCAILSIKLIDLNSEISPWFPLILGAYPVWEVLFSAYRRKKKRKHPFFPDKLHFHTLIYYRLTRSNPKASAFIMLGDFLFSLIAFVVKTCTTCLIIEFVVFIIIYLMIYRYVINKFYKSAR